MKEYIVKITDADVYINGELKYFSRPMDEENKEIDLNKKALLALADEMGYEAIFLFEEMADRLDAMLDEPDLVLDEDDYDLDEPTGNIIVHESVCGGLHIGSYVSIHFTDDNDSGRIAQYKIVSKQDEFFVMEYFGA